MSGPAPGPGSPGASRSDPNEPGGTLEPLVRRLRAAGCVFAEEEAALILAQAGDPAEVDRLATARESGLPLEQVLGWAELGGVRVGLEPGVFVPRRRTELMVATAVSLGLAVPAGRGPVVLLDLCCGSGAVALAVGHGLRRVGVAVEVTAADVDPVAVRCAARNLPGARVLASDLFAALPTTSGAGSTCSRPTSRTCRPPLSP